MGGIGGASFLWNSSVEEALVTKGIAMICSVLTTCEDTVAHLILTLKLIRTDQHGLLLWHELSLLVLPHVRELPG